MREPIEPVAPLLRVLADPNRLRIVQALTEECQSVSDIVGATCLAQPLVSHHLRALREHGLAQAKREGRFTTY